MIVKNQSPWWGISAAILVAILVPHSPTRASDPPNIVLINLDDADRGMFTERSLERFFPNINSIAKRGVTFSNCHVTSPLCGPSRACLLRGQYAHAIDHRTNNASVPRYTRGFQGDYVSFREKGFADDDIGSWMQSAGYHTVFVGKYINGTLLAPPRVHQGWNDFYHALHGIYYGTPRFTNRRSAQGDSETLAPGAYRTHVEGLDLARVIRRQSNNTQPLFVYYAPYGPHSASSESGGMIDENLANLWPKMRLPKNRSFNEANISDKPTIYSQLAQLTVNVKEKLEALHRERMISTKSIDIAIGRIIRALDETDRLENTYFLVTSDNGFLMGHHRMMAKAVSLTQATNVPLIVAGPAVPEKATINHLIAHIDLAPTILDLAGQAPKPFFDGFSFKPLLDDPSSSPPAEWRDSFLIENWQTKYFLGRAMNTTFTQLRMYDAAYTEWADGSIEFYDHQSDPFEMQNTASSLSPADCEEFRNQMVRQRRRMSRPITTIENPQIDFSPILGPPFVIRGVAEDSTGIRSVRLVIREPTSDKYWNGSGWQEKRITINANLKNPSGIVSDWQYIFDPGPDAKDTDSYVIVARAFSNGGKSTNGVPIKRFRYDSLPPVTTLNQLSVANNRLFLNGGSNDNYHVKQVAIELTNRKGEYLKGNSWTTEPSRTMVSTSSNGNWTWRSPVLPKGNYKVKAIAQDRARNWDPNPPENTLTVQ